MQAVLTKNSKVSAGNLNQTLERLFKDIDTADNMTKNSIENDIVRFGSEAADFLVDKVRTAKGSQRGVAAMSLIRIGEDSIKPLREKAVHDRDFQWIANYLIREISGR